MKNNHYRYFVSQLFRGFAGGALFYIFETLSEIFAEFGILENLNCNEETKFFLTKLITVGLVCIILCFFDRIETKRYHRLEKYKKNFKDIEGFSDFINKNPDVSDAEIYEFVVAYFKKKNKESYLCQKDM